ncbi:PH domain-containing protein [Thalassotalea aquiviva]|uniref:PH domain-containing protein n=1 Tax=Thalassotalea aquiviva TaxID=3242415 RepID=UPI00352B9FD0
MIDFNNSSVFKLKPINNSDAKEGFLKLLINGENIVATFKSIRDQVVFTNKRIIAANVQGITGSKVDYTSIPYSKIQTFSVESSGSFDMDCELQLYISAVGKVSFEISGSFDILPFNRSLAEFILS